MPHTLAFSARALAALNLIRLPLVRRSIRNIPCGVPRREARVSGPSPRPHFQRIV
jgi:hypothetical protein